MDYTCKWGASPFQVKSPTRSVIITGPNTGGKTATLKALGLAVLAAKSGLPIPAAAPAKLPCFDVVLADIGESLCAGDASLGLYHAGVLVGGLRGVVFLDLEWHAEGHVPHTAGHGGQPVATSLATFVINKTL